MGDYMFCDLDCKAYFFAHWLLIVSILGGILVTAAVVCLIIRYTQKGGENNA